MGTLRHGYENGMDFRGNGCWKIKCSVPGQGQGLPFGEPGDALLREKFYGVLPQPRWYVTLQKIEGKSWNVTFWVVLVENFWEKRNFLKDSTVFSVGMFQTVLRYQFQGFDSCFRRHYYNDFANPDSLSIC